MTDIQSLPAELRLQILRQLPLGTVLSMKSLSATLSRDVDCLLASRTFIHDIVNRLHAKIRHDHQGALERYLGSNDRSLCDDLIHTMFVLIHLMKFVGQLKLHLDVELQGRRSFSASSLGPPRAHKEHDKHELCLDREALLEVISRCKSAARQCNAGKKDLWTIDLKRMLYPSLDQYDFLDV